MTLRQELDVYKKMYRWYRLPSWLLWILELLDISDTEQGFCNFLTEKLYGNYVIEDLKMLFDRRPPIYKRLHEHTEYWFPKGAIKPRRELLKQCITELKHQLEL